MTLQTGLAVPCFAIASLCVAAMSGCRGTPSEPAAEMAVEASATAGDGPMGSLAATEVEFIDVTADVGVQFVHRSGATGKKYLPETLGAGGLVLDVDDDGWQDLLLVNSGSLGGGSGAGTLPALYRNAGDGTFADVTRGSGLDVALYGIGGTAADYDNDGHTDIYLTALGPNRLLSGRGDGTFSDVTEAAGVGDPGFSTSAAWFDYDNDGDLDLFVANYVEWTIDTDLFCTLDGENKSYCTPEAYNGQSPTLYRNDGDGTFENVTATAGLHDPSSKALGVAMVDYDADGWMDLFVANDTEPDRLYRNQGDGTFADNGVVAGVAFSEGGVARAGMGVDAVDYDRSGRPGLVVGNFSNEMIALYHNEGNGLFIDEAPRSAIGSSSLLTLAFACFFFDYDLDGRPDIFAANGHVADDIERVQPRVTYAQPAHLFRNLGEGQFAEVASEAGGSLMRPTVARGAAYGDLDRDGDLDLLITANNGPARVLRNEGGSANNVLRVRIEGTASNRDGIGARVEVTVGGGQIWQIVKTGSSYASQSELPVTFGLGAATAVDALTVTWPSGAVDQVAGVEANREVMVREGEGAVGMEPLER